MQYIRPKVSTLICGMAPDGVRDCDWRAKKQCVSRLPNFRSDGAPALGGFSGHAGRFLISRATSSRPREADVSK